MTRRNGKAARAVGRRVRAAAAPRAPASAAATAPQPLDLEQVRARIDAVDEQIHGLINERARLAQQVGISKSSDGRTVDFYRPEREAQVLRLARAPHPGPLRDAEGLPLLRRILAACLAPQAAPKRAFARAECTLTPTAVLHHFWPS